MANYIKALHIKGYKRFENFHIEFQEGLNILIGENSVGKSTVLEAINIVLNQYYFNGFSNEDQQELNMNNIDHFLKKKSPQTRDLPVIEIEIELALDNELKNQRFYGQNYNLLSKDSDENCRYGINFKFSFDEAYDSEFNNIDFSNDANKVIPIEYYHAVWTTFSGQAYKRNMNPLKSILIDSSENKKDIYGNYARNLYRASLSEGDQRKLSYVFSNSLKNFLSDKKDILDIGEKRTFALDEQKSKLNNLIEIQEDNISLRNMGKGEENILKTSLSLQKKVNLDLVMLEEPENHLSYSNTRKQIDRIQEKEKNVSQIIATTHESMIINKLNLMKAIWIKENKGQSLKDLPKDDALYFEKADNFDILRYVLGNRIILVEGASEYILLPAIVKYALNKDLDENKISIISMRGIHYNHFKSLSKIVNKKTLVLTDNDGDVTRIQNINIINNDVFKVNMPKDIDEFTFEVTLYNNNKELCEQIIKEITKGKLRNTRYKQHEDLPNTLAAMLTRKTEFALKLAEKIKGMVEFRTPEYIEEGITWLLK